MARKRAMQRDTAAPSEGGFLKVKDATGTTIAYVSATVLKPETIFANGECFISTKPTTLIEN